MPSPTQVQKDKRKLSRAQAKIILKKDSAR